MIFLTLPLTSISPAQLSFQGPENGSDFRGISRPHIRGSHRANAELAFPFMLCPWDYHINLRDLITRLQLAARALDQAIPPLLLSN